MSETDSAADRVEAWQANHRYPDAVPGPEVKGHQRAWGHDCVIHVSPNDLPAYETEGSR